RRRRRARAGSLWASPSGMASPAASGSGAWREAEPGQRFGENLGEQLVERPPHELRDDPERTVGREGRQRVHLEEVRLARTIEPEVGTGKVPALQRLERPPPEVH